jgi:integrase
MKVPEPRRLPSGRWFVQLRLGGESISITADTEKECRQQAILVKAEHLVGKRKSPKSKTLREEIDAYISARSNTLSPLTIRGYRIIQKNRFQAIMDRVPAKIKSSEYQGIVNAEAALCKPKTLKNAWGFVRTIIHEATGEYPPDVKLPAQVPNSHGFLTPDQIRTFVRAVSTTKYCIPALLALSSLRISEIEALRWEDVPKDLKLIRVAGAVVLDENNNWVKKAANKTASSTRAVPVMIPELTEALKRERQKHGPVMTISQNSLRYGIKKICEDNGLPNVGIHGLRHSFASLAYHLQIPEMIAAEIGGWSDTATMHRIYTHIAQEDVAHYQTAMESWYKNANKKR